MNIIDLTHMMCNDMPVYSEVSKPNIRKVATIDEDGYEESYLSMFSHNGTHIDSTKHMHKEGKTLDNLDINNFAGKACVINIKEDKIHLNHLKKYENEILKSDFVIFKSGWSKYWGEKTYYENYPILTIEAAKYIANSNLKGIGIDMLSVDSYSSEDFEIHQILFEGGKLIVENLTNLEKLPKEFLFVVAPLKYKNADGSPVRAIGIEY